MLSVVKNEIQVVSDLNFSDYYSDYVLSVQDKNMESEFRFLIKYNSLCVDNMQFLIQNTYERLGDLYNDKS